MAEVACDDRPLVFEDLVQWMADGAKPPSEWRVGAEHEKFVFRLADHSPVPYEPGGIKALLDGLTRFGWAPVMEGENVIALERGKANVELWHSAELRRDTLAAAGDALRATLLAGLHEFGAYKKLESPEKKDH